MVSINDNEILIMGGDGEKGFQQDAYILYTEANDRISDQKATFNLRSTIFTNGEEISTWSNQCQNTRAASDCSCGEIVALVQGEDWEPYLITCKPSGEVETRIERVEEEDQKLQLDEAEEVK